METIDLPMISLRNGKLKSIKLLNYSIFIFFLLSNLDLYSQCSSPITSFPISDDFEVSVGNWIQDSADDFDWTRNSGTTGSGGTGPTSGANGSTWYMYTEASSPNTSGQIANLISPCISLSGPSSFDFSYHMYSTDVMGTFNVDVRINASGEWTNIWTKTGNQGNIWIEESLVLDAYIGQNIELRFSVTINTFRTDIAIDNVSIVGPPEICGNDIDDDNDGTTDEIILTNPFPGFPIDFLNNNTGWVDYDLGSDLSISENQDGNLTISGSIENGTPVDFGSGMNGNSCGSTDSWDLTMTLSDKMDWTEWQAASGNANMNGSCSGSESDLDYWDVSGTLVGTGCNVGRTINITGPKSPYRLQIGLGGNSGDNLCTFGMSTWFNLNEGGTSYNADIYAFLDQTCYEEFNPDNPCTPGTLTLERWNNITGTSVTDLTSNGSYPNNPDETGELTSFQGPSAYGDNYGTRVRGYISPLESGTYSFNVTGDDNIILYLSTSSLESNKIEIASVSGWSGVVDHTKYIEQTSNNINLTVGNQYYIELLHKEGGGGDHFQVYWKTPSVAAAWNIIPTEVLSPFDCQENCDNGIDDDGDNLIDEYDPDCSCLGSGIPNISFNQYPDGQNLNAGDIVSEVWASYGIHISTTDLPSSNYPPMIFDSNNTLSDPDLGTPNSDFGGAGVGDGGKAGEPGENNANLGNVLIVSDNYNINDYHNGGTIVFNFDTDVDIASIEIVDFDYNNPDGTVKAYDSSNNLIKEQPIYAYGDNSYQKINVSITNARRLEVAATNSFSIASLNFCDDDLPIASIGDLVWFDSNQDGLSAGEFGIENILVELYNSSNDLLAETTTDASGNYLFENLAPGQYKVEIDPPSGFAPTGDLDSDNDNDSGVFTIAANQNRLDVDFGLYQNCSNDLSIANVSVGACIDQPLRDVSEVSFDVSWTGSYLNEDIIVKIGDRTEVIPVSDGATSPFSIDLIFPADGTSETIIADWESTSGLCLVSSNFTLPSDCSSDQLSCSVLYLCGLDKPYDGDAWDHGWVTYIDQVNGSNAITPILTKDEAGMGTYDVMNPGTFVNLTLSDYDIIIISATTENHISTDLVTALRDAPNSIMLSNYAIISEMGMSSEAGSVKWGSSANTNATTSELISTYNNPGSWSSPLFTKGNYSNEAITTLWGSNSGEANTTDGIIYRNDASDPLIGTADTHGNRIYMGYHFNGIYANATNNGALPSPVSSWFTPEKHLTLKGKELFDQALVYAGTNCIDEVCDDGKDNDGDGSADSDDLECYDCQEGILVNPGFEDGLVPWDNYNGVASIEIEANGNKFVKISGGSGGIGQYVDIAEGDSIFLSFIARKSGIESFQAGVSFYDVSLNLIGGEIVVDVDTDIFARYEVVALAPANVAYVKAFAFKDDAGGAGFLDGFCLENEPDPCFDLEPGIISGDEINCSAFTSSPLMSYIDPIIGDGSYTIQWQVSSDELAWSDISGATGSTYNPGSISSTKYYRRVALANDCAYQVHSNVIAKIVDPTLAICPGDDYFEFPCEAGYSISPAGKGIKGLDNPSIRVFNPSLSEYYIVEATFSGGIGSADQVIFSNKEGDTRVVQKIYLDGESGQNGNRYFKTILPPSDSIFLSYEGDNILAESIIVYPVRSTNDIQSFGQSVHQELLPGQSYEASFPLTPSVNGKDVYSSFSISGIENGSNEVNITVFGDGASGTETVVDENYGSSLNLEYINLEEISPNADSIHVLIEVPATSTESVLLSGYIGIVSVCDRYLVVTAETSPDCVAEGDIITYEYTLYNFEDVEFNNISGSSSIGGSINFPSVLAANSQVTVFQDIVITATLLQTQPLINDVSIAGWNFTEFGVKPKGDSFIDTLLICEICDNGLDDDGDGFTDCLDSDCIITNTFGNAGVDQSICEGGSVTLTASGGDSYSWSNSAGNTASVSISPSSTTTYTVTVTNAQGCISTDQVTVTINKDITVITSGNTIICSGETSILTSTISGGAGTTSYQWQRSSNGNLWEEISGATSDTYTTPALLAKTYYRVSVISSASGCNSVISAEVFVDVELESQIATTTDDQEICIGESVTLSVNDGIETGGLIDYTEWTTGTGSVGTFYRNGTDNENHRVMDSDPWGNSTVVWEARPEAASGSDGGWNTAYKNVDHTKGYRLSVWVNRKVMGLNGRFYLGTGGFGSVNGVRDVATGTNSTNPYFYTSGSPSTNMGDEDEWILIVGHVFPSDYSGTTKNPDSGRYTIADGKIGNTTRDYKWLPETTQARHRSYLYYSTDTNVRQQWVYPRFDIMDGTEPSIDQILNGFDVNGGLGEGAQWEWYTGSCGGTSVGSGSSITVSPNAGTEYFVRAEGDCNTTACESVNVTVNTPPNASASNDGPIACNGGTVEITALPAGLNYLWEDGSTGQTRQVSIGGIYKVTVTSGAGCESIASTEVTSFNAPTVSFTGDTELCLGEGTTLSPTTGGSWLSSDTDVAIVSSSGIVISAGPGTATFTFTDGNSNCTATTEILTVNPDMTVSIDNNGASCIQDGSQLTAIPSGGSPNYIYNWRFPDNSTASGVTVDITLNGNYYLTVTDNAGCTAETSGFIYSAFEPFIFSLETSVCEGETVDLEINGSNITAYAWDSNAGSANTSSVTVTPSSPSSTYIVTVTNTNGCTSTASATIGVEALPLANAGSDVNICEGETISISTTDAGAGINYSWGFGPNATPSAASGSGPHNVTYNNPNANGGNQSNTVTLTVTKGDCTNTDTKNITILAQPDPTVTFSSPSCGVDDGIITFGFVDNPDRTNVQFSINGGVTYPYNTNDNVGSYTVSDLAPGDYDLYTKWGDNSCPVTISSVTLADNTIPTITNSGDATLCKGSTTILNASTSGSWTSDDDGVASVSAAGVVLGVSAGVVNISFVADNTCAAAGSLQITVTDKEGVTITGDNILCEGTTTTLIPSKGGGTWLSNNNSIATVNTSGIVTAVSAGIVLISYDHSSNSCTENSSFAIEVFDTPTASIIGATEVCVGETTTITTDGTGGYWTSSDNTIAIVSSTGQVSGIAAGDVTFHYTTGDNCPSPNTGTLTVTPAVSVAIDFNGSECLTDDSKLSAMVTGGTSGYSYAWTGPGGFTGNTMIIDISLDGNYYVTVTDSKGCTDDVSAFVYESYDPFIFALNTTVCEGESVTLSVSGASATGYQWSSSAGSVTTQSVTVVPTVPSTSYTVTVTNSIGCTTEATASIMVDAKPTVSITGSTDLCVGETTQLSPTTGGEWTSANSSVASVTNGGLVTGIANGSTAFTFKSNTTGCTSNPTAAVNIGANGSVTIAGDNQICFSDGPTLTASVTGGSWSSSNLGVATIDANGVVTPQGQGTTTILYDVTAGGCYDDGSYAITINNDPTVSLNGPSTICEGYNTFVNSSISGTWSSSDETIATISNTGVITGVSGGNATISFISGAGCTASLSTPIIVIGAPEVTRLGPPEVCINSNTSLSPTSGGVWISSNNSIASVNSTGIVTGKSVGTAIFTFIEASNGCISDEVIAITVFGPPTINGLSDSDLCIGETTNITPSTGGTWVSTDALVATITDSGIITAVSSGSARFTYTSDATGCESSLSAPLSVNGKPTISYTGPTAICKDEQTNISPTTGGQWSSTDVSVATISESGVITGINPGTVSFIYRNDITGCSSDASAPLTVKEPTTIELTGPSAICVNEVTSITPNSGGSWSSSNVNVASISNAGVIIGHNPGAVTFTFDSNAGCTSDPSIGITVVSNPITTFTGPSEICIGSTTNLSPGTGGEWTSSDTNVATVDNSGLVTAVGFGTAQFTFKHNVTGCQSTTDGSVSVYNKPVPVIIGDDEICIGFATHLTPNTGGVWTSSNTSVAVISSSGQVTGISPGTATFTFYETGSNCVSEPSAPITILQKAPVSITGGNTICVGGTTSVSPTTGGSWVSNNLGVATVTDAGVVTGVSQGIAKFSFISNTGCESNETTPVIVYGSPSVSISGPDQLCIGDQVQMLPSTGGEWTSNNTSVASIDINGLVTALSEGVANFTFIDDITGCTSDLSDELTVNASPATGVNGLSDICIGSTTYLFPSSGGIWTALDPSIATIQNNGQVSGITSGNARFVFTQLSSGCQSEVNNDITVLSVPEINFTGPALICEGETTSIISANAGTWESAYPQIATITNGGIITGISPGSVKFIFTDNTTGCMSDLSETLTVSGPPTVSVAGSSIICIGSSTILSPSTGGVWESLNPEIAVTTESGTVTGVAEGTAYFRFTDSVTGCESDGTLSLNVATEIDAQITGDSEICTGYTTTLSPNSGGTWTSSNQAIATVSNFGVVTGKAPGVVTFTFVDASNGCSAGGTTEPITVSNCINHDFNVAIVDQTIIGNVNTNDNISSDATYSNIKITVEKPLASLPQLTINPDGSYSFVTNKPGKYLYKVSVCLPSMVSGCPSAFLEINVLDNVYGQSNPLSNLEYSTTYANLDNSIAGNTISIKPLANDDCVYTAGCELDNSTLTIIGSPGNGTIVLTGAGSYDYTPSPGFIGQDTIQYQVCESGGNCSTSRQIITVNAPNALNSVVAADDFAYTLKGITKSGNVVTNDFDPENDAMTITQQGSMMNPVVITEGEYYINNDGSYEFTPNSSFSGALEIVYTVCDDNTDIACTNATIHIQVFDDLSLRLRVYLEGALMQNDNEVSFDGRPLMRDGLRVSPHTGENYIPIKDPYTYGNEMFDNTPEKFVKVGPGLIAENLVISDSLAVFSVTGDNAIVDWIHVELRDKNDNKVTIATRSGLVQRDGDIVDLDGVSALRFQGINIDSFYVCVRHRTHLGVMSELVSGTGLVDFTTPSTTTFNFGTSLSNGIDYTELSQKSNVKSGYLALWAGDFNSDGKLKFTEPASDINILYANVLFTSPEFFINYDFTHGYYRGDFNMDGKAKYANPNDDRNFLQAQIIFHPLNTNYISNLDGVIQQIP